MMSDLAMFSDHVGEQFLVDVGLPDPIEIRLVGASGIKARPGAGRPDPFQLRFRGAGPYGLVQHTHRLRNDRLGEVDIFLVPIGREDGEFLYQAIFN